MLERTVGNYNNVVSISRREELSLLTRLEQDHYDQDVPYDLSVCERKSEQQEQISRLTSSIYHEYQMTDYLNDIIVIILVNLHSVVSSRGTLS